MKKQRIYVDTSVIGGCFDSEFEVWSLGLMNDFRSARHSPVVSTLVGNEIVAAPPFVRSLYQELIRLGAEVLQIDEAAVDLAEQYLRHRILSRRYMADCLHIALASCGCGPAGELELSSRRPV